MRELTPDEVLAMRACQSASQDAEILRLRGVLERTAFALETVTVQLNSWGHQSPLNIRKFLAEAVAALSSPAPHEDVRVPRELLGRIQNALSFAQSAIRCGEPWTETCRKDIHEPAAELRALLKD